MEASNLQRRTSQDLPDLPSADMLANIAAGTILLLSGIIHLKHITSTLKTVLGGYLLFKGLTAYSNSGGSVNTNRDAGPEQTLSEADTLIMVTE